MRRLALIVIFSLSLAACASAPQVVKVPVAVPPPPPPVTARPHLPIADLRPDATPSVVLKAYEISVEKLMGYAGELEEILKGYR